MIPASLSQIIFHESSLSNQYFREFYLYPGQFCIQDFVHSFPPMNAWSGFKVLHKCLLFQEACLDCPLKPYSPLAVPVLAFVSLKAEPEEQAPVCNLFGKWDDSGE